MKLKHNIYKNYVYVFVSSLSITDAIWMLFLAYRGMTLVQIGLLESIFHISSMLMEIPTGLVADRYGRKTSRVIGRVLALMSTAMMLGANSFWMFAVAFVLSSLSYNMESGAGDALIYDTLIATGDEKKYMFIKGLMEVSFQTARTSSLVIGGWVATINYELGYAIALVINGIAIVSALTFKEPEVAKAEEADAHAENLWSHIKGSIEVIKNNRHILNYIWFSEGFSLFHTTLYFYFQNFLKSKGYTEAWIGIALASASLLSLLFSTQTHRFEKWFGRLTIVKVATVCVLLALAGVAFTSFEVAFFIVMSCLDGVLFVAFSDYINQLIPSEHRATLLSFQAMVFSVLMIIYFPIFGWVAWTFGFKAGFTMLFASAVPLMLYTYGKLKRTIGS